MYKRRRRGMSKMSGPVKAKPGSFTRIYLHIVFAVKYRKGMIQPTWKEELYKYITGIVKEEGHLLIRINGMPDHIHILIAYKATRPLTDLVRIIKCNSSKFINERSFCQGRFEWQNGYGAFSCDHRHLDEIIRYIERQEIHHAKKKLREEYIELLRQYELEFSEQFLFSETT